MKTPKFLRRPGPAADTASDLSVSARSRWFRAIRFKPSRTRILALSLVAVVAVFAALSSGLLRDHHDADNKRGNDAALLDAARSGVTAMISISDTSAADDVNKVLEQSTGAFKNDFESRSKSFIAVVQEAKVVTKGDVLGMGIESRQGDSATVLVSASSSISNAAGAANESRSWRLRVIMTEESGQYKMSSVEFVA